MSKGQSSRHVVFTRVTLFAAVGGIVLTLAAAGARAGGFSFMNWAHKQDSASLASPSAPTATTLFAGDIAFTGYHGNTPVSDVFSFVLF